MGVDFTVYNRYLAPGFPPSPAVPGHKAKSKAWAPRVNVGECHELAERQGQRREPATGSVRIATRRVGWRPFAEPSSSIKLSGTPAGISPASGAWPVPEAVALSVWIVVMSGWETVSEGSGVIGGRW